MNATIPNGKQTTVLGNNVKFSLNSVLFHFGCMVASSVQCPSQLAMMVDVEVVVLNSRVYEPFAYTVA